MQENDKICIVNLRISKIENKGQTVTYNIGIKSSRISSFKIGAKNRKVRLYTFSSQWRKKIIIKIKQE